MSTITTDRAAEFVRSLPDESPARTLIAELMRQKETRRDVMADTRHVSFGIIDPPHNELLKEALGPLALHVDLPDGAEAFALTKHAHQQTATHLGIPWKLYERLTFGGTTAKGKSKPAHPDLLANLANGLLAREPSKRMLRTLDGKVRAFLSDRYRRRDNWELMFDAIIPVLADFPGEFSFKECSLTETQLYVKIVLPGFERPVTPKVGDSIQGGVIIRNSEVGNGQLMVAPYTMVLACLNGMVHTQYGQGQRHVGKRITNDDGDEAWDLYSDETMRLDDAAYFAKVADTVRGVMTETVFDRIVAEMRDLAGIEVPDVPAAVEILTDRHGFSETERASILDALFDARDRSAWGMVNAITATARVLDDADRKVELETLAGTLTTSREWATSLAA